MDLGLISVISRNVVSSPLAFKMFLNPVSTLYASVSAGRDKNVKVVKMSNRAQTVVAYNKENCRNSPSSNVIASLWTD